MSDLSPQARAFLDAHADEGLPSPGDRERVRAAAVAALAAPSPSPAPAPASVGLAKLGLGLVVSASLIAGLALWARGEGAGRREETVASPPATVVTPPAPQVPPVEASAPAAPPPAPSPSVGAPRKNAPTPPAVGAQAAPAPEERPAAPERPEVDPAEEFRLLAQAQASTREGNPGWALELLEQHHRRFGAKALLEEEALAARVMAQCGLGRATEAEATAALLRALNPASVHLSKVERACW